MAGHGKVFVLTHRPPAELVNTDGDLPVTFLTGAVEDAVATALDAAAGKDVVVFGPTIAGACIQTGVLDEILVHIVPVLLGDGVRFFDHPGMTRPVPLRRTALAESGQLTDLRFAVKV
jgi:dihydrofolate reductase